MTRPGFEFPTFLRGSLHSTDSVTASVQVLEVVLKEMTVVVVLAVVVVTVVVVIIEVGG